MADGRPYADLPIRKMAGCYGPRRKEATAMVAYTPNVPWARRGCSDLIDWDGGGVNDNITLDTFFGTLDASSISGTEGSTKGWHLHVGFSPAGSSKYTSIGFKRGGQKAEMNGRLQLIDALSELAKHLVIDFDSRRRKLLIRFRTKSWATEWSQPANQGPC